MRIARARRLPARAPPSGARHRRAALPLPAGRAPAPEPRGHRSRHFQVRRFALVAVREHGGVPGGGMARWGSCRAVRPCIAIAVWHGIRSSSFRRWNSFFNKHVLTSRRRQSPSRIESRWTEPSGEHRRELRPESWCARTYGLAGLSILERRRPYLEGRWKVEEELGLTRSKSSHRASGGRAPGWRSGSVQRSTTRRPRHPGDHGEGPRCRRSSKETTAGTPSALVK